MHQKDLAKLSWQKAGYYDSADARLRAFLKHVDNIPEHCWPELVQEVRQNYPELKEKLVVPLWQTGDKLVRLNLIQALDPHQADEMALLQKLVRRLRVVDDPHELRAVVAKQHPKLMDLVARKKGITPEFRRHIELQRGMLV